MSVNKVLVEYQNAMTKVMAKEISHLRKALKKSQEVNDNFNRLSAEHADFINKYDEEKRKSDLFQKLYNELMEKYDGLEKVYQDLQEDIEALIAGKTKLEERLDIEEERSYSIQRDFDVLDRENSALKDENFQLESELEYVKAELENAQSTIKNLLDTMANCYDANSQGIDGQPAD